MRASLHLAVAKLKNFVGVAQGYNFLKKELTVAGVAHQGKIHFQGCNFLPECEAEKASGKKADKPALIFPVQYKMMTRL